MTFYSIALNCSHLPEVQLFCLSPADISGKSSGHLLDEPSQIKADSLPIFIVYLLEILFTICPSFILPSVQLFVSARFLAFTHLDETGTKIAIEYWQEKNSHKRDKAGSETALPFLLLNFNAYCAED